MSCTEPCFAITAANAKSSIRSILCLIRTGYRAVRTAAASCGGIVRPDVTLYDEMLPEGVFEESARRVSRADVLIVAGTSLAVYPAASLLQFFRGRRLVVVNLTPTSADSLADLAVHARAGDVLGEAADEILGAEQA